MAHACMDSGEYFYSYVDESYLNGRVSQRGLHGTSHAAFMRIFLHAFASLNYQVYSVEMSFPPSTKSSGYISNFFVGEANITGHKRNGHKRSRSLNSSPSIYILHDLLFSGCSYSSSSNPYMYGDINALYGFDCESAGPVYFCPD